MPEREPTPKKKTGAPRIEVTPEMIEAAIDEIIEAGVLEDPRPCQNRGSLRLMMADVFTAALDVSGVPYRIAKSQLKAR